MDSVTETLELCRRITTGYRPALRNSPVADCTRRFELLPLRYAAVGGNPAQRARLPKLPGYLSPFQDVGDLTHSDYAIRPLREGFLYLLIKRHSEPAYQWHSQYRVAPNGSLLYIRADAPWESAPNAANLEEIIRGFGWTITLYDLDDIQELRPLFSPSPLTPRMLDNYRLLEDEYRSSLPAIDIAQFIQPSDAPPQNHVLKHDQLGWVADFKAQEDSDLKALLDMQPFNNDQIVSPHASRQALAPLVNQTKPRGAAIVIEDAIGITQELNAWRNAAVDDVKTKWLRHSVEPGVDNERRLLIAQSFLEIEKLYPQMMADRIVKREVMAETIRNQPATPVEFYAFSDRARQQADAHDERMRPQLEKFERDVRAKVQSRQDSGEFSKKFDQKYGHLVDRQAMHDQLESFEQAMQQAQQETEDRAKDHARWLISERLLQALDRYDNADLINGLAFAEQTGQCVIGMELSEWGTTVLDHWWRSDVADRSNLAIRGITYNQDDIRDALATLREAAMAKPPSESWFVLRESLVRQAHIAANAFGRANALYEELQNRNSHASIGLYAWYVALGRQVLRTGAPNSMDRALHHGLRLTLFASVHETAVDIRLSDAARSGQPLNPQRSAGQAGRYLDQAWAEGLMQANKSDFYKVRVSSLVCLLEGMLMAFKARELPGSDVRIKTELMAAAMTTAAAGFEIGASYVEQVVTRYGANSVTGRGAVATLGRLKLWGAGLAGMGGFVLAWWDFADGVKSHTQPSASTKSWTLSGAYFTRALATLALSVGELGTAIGIAKPLFDRLTINNQSKLIRLVGRSLSSLATRLGTQAARLLLTKLILGAFWVGLLLTTIIFLLEDDALEKWCKRSSYRLDKSSKPYDEREELAALHSAFSEVL
ncbi:T6SS effector BTH_I2691 family protein [Pseudomonas inefficax]|uniref:T6SS effector BTH_I2691 family protein n=1 Tax=Pseudomonas inefficax TaxID=2078786 RepID=UPI0028BF1B01|nr:T6SS effector BTH_I2691 family protein [Pseudomonas inefficax]WNN39643.1 T6SS effector BTH_I2691 family protein [Pseudomonas inefficax]